MRPLLAIGALVCLSGGMFWLLGDSGEVKVEEVAAVIAVMEPDAASKPDVRVEPDAAEAKVPEGLKGLRFGMTPAGARAVVKQIKPLPTKAQCKDVDRKDECEEQVERWNLDDEPGVEGPRLGVETLLFGEPALCYLTFGVRGTLSRIACRVDPPDHNEDEVWRGITRQMRDRWPKFDALTGRVDGYVWDNQKARLAVKNHVVLRGATIPILIINASADHAMVREAVEAEQDRKLEAWEAAKRQAAKRKRQERIERLKRLEGSK